MFDLNLISSMVKASVQNALNLLERGQDIG